MYGSDGSFFAAGAPLGALSSPTGGYGGGGGGGRRGRDRGGRPLPQFVQSLYRMVMSDAHLNLVSWNEEGTSLIIHNVDEFTRCVLPLHFKVRAPPRVAAVPSPLLPPSHGPFHPRSTPTSRPSLASCASTSERGSGWGEGGGGLCPHVVPLYPLPMSMCSFKKLTKLHAAAGSVKTLEYAHPFFMRGRTDLLPLVVRKTNNSARTTLEGACLDEREGGGRGGGGHGCMLPLRRHRAPLQRRSCDCGRSTVEAHRRLRSPSISLPWW